MSGRIATEISATITGASATGYLTLASTTGFYKKAKAYIKATDQDDKEVVITEVTNTTLGIRFARALGQGPDYGRNDVSAYNGGTISMPEQIIYNPNEVGITS